VEKDNTGFLLVTYKCVNINVKEGVSMIAAERKLRIVEYVTQYGIATVTALAQMFDVHEATIRRDLMEFEQEGVLKRTHGGVILEQWTNEEPPFYERYTTQLEQKMRIGKMAASLVEDGEHIIIDSGTTTLHIAKNLVNHSNITVVTNDINIAAELRDAPGVKVILTGGELYPSSYMLNGMFTDHNLSLLHVEKAFIGIPAIHPKHGLMHPEAALVQAKRGMIQAAREIIVVADDSKIGKLSLHTVAPNNSLHTLITGKETSEQELKPFRDFGIMVYTV
jgi:DeoR family fructose operon transcriptional repressor